MEKAKSYKKSLCNYLTCTKINLITLLIASTKKMLFANKIKILQAPNHRLSNPKKGLMATLN